MSYSLAEAAYYLNSETGNKIQITPRLLCEWSAKNNRPKLQIAYFGEAREQLSWDIKTGMPVISEKANHISNWFYLTSGDLFKFMFKDSVKIDFFMLDMEIWWPEPAVEITMDKLVMTEYEALNLRDSILSFESDLQVSNDCHPFESLKPLQRQRFQEVEILRVIKELGYDAQNLPPVKLGSRKDIKTLVRNQLNNKDFQGTIFKKAWERLAYNSDIKRI